MKLATKTSNVRVTTATSRIGGRPRSERGVVHKGLDDNSFMGNTASTLMEVK